MTNTTSSFETLGPLEFSSDVAALTLPPTASESPALFTAATTTAIMRYRILDEAATTTESSILATLSNISNVSNTTDAGARGSQFLQEYIRSFESTTFQMRFYGTFLVVVIGLLGNFISFAVMRSKSLRNKAYGYYLSILAIFDSSVLIFESIELAYIVVLVRSNMKTFIYGFADWDCKLYSYSKHICYLLSSWIIVIITAERFLSIYYPFRSKLICRGRKAIGVFACISIVLSASVAYLPVMTVRQPNLLSPCNRLPVSLSVMLHTYYFLPMYCIVPTIIISACNAAVMAKMRSSARSKIRKCQASTASGGNAGGTEQRAISYKSTIMLIYVSFLYCVIVLPAVAFVMVSSFIFGDKLPLDVYMTLTQVTNVLELLKLVNYADNFFVYILWGKTFREEFFRILYKLGVFKRLLEKYQQVPGLVTHSTHNARASGKLGQVAGAGGSSDALGAQGHLLASRQRSHQPHGEQDGRHDNGNVRLNHVGRYADTPGSRRTLFEQHKLLSESVTSL